jgi:hypothetical protein
MFRGQRFEPDMLTGQRRAVLPDIRHTRQHTVCTGPRKTGDHAETRLLALRRAENPQDLGHGQVADEGQALREVAEHPL